MNGDDEMIMWFLVSDTLSIEQSTPSEALPIFIMLSQLPATCPANGLGNRQNINIGNNYSTRGTRHW